MPLRAYEPVNPPCRLCGAGFELMQKAGEPPLTSCPKCGQAVTTRAAPPIAVTRLTRAVSTSEAKAAGFSVLKRTADGTFEKQ